MVDSSSGSGSGGSSSGSSTVNVAQSSNTKKIVPSMGQISRECLDWPVGRASN